jgi:hypothetical protein
VYDGCFAALYAYAFRSAGGDVAPAKPAPRRPPLPDEIRAALQIPVAVDFRDATLGDIVQLFREKAENVVFVVDRNIDVEDYTATITIRRPTALSTLWSTLYDNFDGEFCLVIRDYGVLLTTTERASEMYAPTLPEHVELRPEAVR